MEKYIDDLGNEWEWNEDIEKYLIVKLKEEKSQMTLMEFLEECTGKEGK